MQNFRKESEEESLQDKNSSKDRKLKINTTLTQSKKNEKNYEVEESTMFDVEKIDTSTMEEDCTLNEEKSNAQSSLNYSSHLSREQEDHYEAMMECVLLEMAAFQASRKTNKDNNQCNFEASDKESDDEKLHLEELIVHKKRKGQRKCG